MHWKYGSFPRLCVKCNHPVGSIHVCTCCMSPGSYMLASVHVCTCCMSPGSYMLASIHVCTCCMSPGSYMLASAGSIMQSTEQEDVCLCNTTSNTLLMPTLASFQASSEVLWHTWRGYCEQGRPNLEMQKSAILNCEELFSRLPILNPTRPSYTFHRIELRQFFEYFDA